MYRLLVMMVIGKNFITYALKEPTISGLFSAPLARKNCTNSSAAVFKLGNFMKMWEHKFEEANVPEARRSIELIVSHVFNCDPNPALLDLAQDKVLTDAEIGEIEKRCGYRLMRMPVQYVIKEWDFRYANLKMRPPVFIPRPETEQLIDIVLANTPEEVTNGMEIGCGSGAISIALLQERKNLRMTAIDQSRVACRLTCINAERNYVGHRLTVCTRELRRDGTIKAVNFRNFDMIVSNPPYIYSSEIPTLEPEIKLYEDLHALDGGKYGLDIIKGILRFASKKLNPSRNLFLEVHKDHAPMIREVLGNKLKNLGLNITNTYKDFANIERFLCITKIAE